MSPELQPGLRFEWSYTIPARATVPNLYHDTAFCRDMPDVLLALFDYPEGFHPERLLSSAFGIIFDKPIQVKIRFSKERLGLIL